MLARFGEAHQEKDVAMADAAARKQANAGPAAAGLLFWWPVDLQFFHALSGTSVTDTTGAS
jgi:hypothetical protein